ncbi:MAG: hypothetical protein VX237_03185, partial [Chloroflexota bacterium]|nr:hypothetical protein [Chloroflexota bacterium]
YRIYHSVTSLRISGSIQVANWPTLVTYQHILFTDNMQLPCDLFCNFYQSISGPTRAHIDPIRNYWAYQLR